MKIIFGLGNPGTEYAGTRHNTGFIAVDSFARERGLSFSEKTKFQAYIAEFTEAGEKVLLVKPTTFYNKTGESARALIDFYKLNPSEDLLVIHDDLALPFGTIRVRKKGSDAGNNGIKSLNAHVESDYPRLRVGAHSENRADDTKFVLSRFDDEEVITLKEKIIPETLKLANNFLNGNLEFTSLKV